MIYSRRMTDRPPYRWHVWAADGDPRRPLLIVAQRLGEEFEWWTAMCTETGRGRRFRRLLDAIDWAREEARSWWNHA